MPVIPRAVPNSVQRKCSHCGRILGPLDKVHTRGALDVCEACFQRLKIKDKQEQVVDEQHYLTLLETIKKCFGVTQVPKKILYQINKIIEDDPRKNYGSIAYTINYAFCRMGVLDPEGGVAGIIGYFYEDAANHYTKEKEVLQHNIQFTPTETTRTVKISPTDPNAPLFTPKTKTEDL